jgi:hypothetical protein
MKRINVTKLVWDFGHADPLSGYTDNRIFIPTITGEKVFGKMQISSQIGEHPAGRCMNVVVCGESGNSYVHEYLQTNIHELTDEDQYRNRDEFGYLKISSALFEDIVAHDGRAWSVQWKLLPNESFLDGAVRIGCRILTQLQAAGHNKNFRKKWMLGHFSVTQKTYVEIKNPKIVGSHVGDWQPIEDYLRYKHGLQE